MLLHIPPPSAALDIANASLYLVVGFAAGVLAAYGFMLKRNARN